MDAPIHSFLLARFVIGFILVFMKAILEGRQTYRTARKTVYRKCACGTKTAHGLAGVWIDGKLTVCFECARCNNRVFVKSK